MKKLSGSILILCLGIYLFVSLASCMHAAPNATPSPVEISAKVGQYHLYVSGYISPYASIVMSSDGVLIRSTVADKYGRFVFQDILINKGFSHFCLRAVDFKRLGESYTCFHFAPAKGDITMKDLFLPPTLGLSRNEIAENAPFKGFGYTMPGAKVTLHLSNGKKIVTTADSTGYYEFEVEGLRAGKYELYSTANYEGKESLVPSEKAKLSSLSLWEQIVAFFMELWRKLAKLLSSVWLNPLWIAVPILILIIILIIKIWPERFTFIYNSRLLGFLPHKRSKKMLHHRWFIGY